VITVQIPPEGTPEFDEFVRKVAAARFPNAAGMSAELDKDTFRLALGWVKAVHQAAQP
jgi:hypothetical protein